MYKLIYEKLVFFLLIIFFISCNTEIVEDDVFLEISCNTEIVEDDVFLELDFTVQAPINYPEAELTSLNVSFLNRKTGKEETPELINGQDLKIRLRLGEYSILASATMKFTTSQGALAEAVLSFEEHLVVNEETRKEKQNIRFIYVRSAASFVIEEAFFTGTLTPEGKQYDSDKYVKITNNSDLLLYADGMAFAETEFQAVDHQDYKPDIRDVAVAIKVIYCIPGSGTDHPVLPGESIVLCESAIDHREINPLSFDLSNADYEWYDEESAKGAETINNPKVPNMINYFSTTSESWAMHNRGFHSFIIAKMPVSKEEYIRDYVYDYEYLFVYKEYSVLFENTTFKVPNDWILDAVNCSVEAEWMWNPISPLLDSGWTYCGTWMHDQTRYSKSVRRKVESVNSTGRRILKDTNNSTEDFEPEVRPSMFKD